VVSVFLPTGPNTPDDHASASGKLSSEHCLRVWALVMTARSCNFCGKTEQEVQKLIAGTTAQRKAEQPLALICNECVELCHQILMAPTRPISEPVWKSFERKGQGYEWCVFPQRDQSRLLVVRRRGTDKSVGWMLTPEDSETDEVAAKVVEAMSHLL
jgi:hypothetical protein